MYVYVYTVFWFLIHNALNQGTISINSQFLFYYKFCKNLMISFKNLTRIFHDFISFFLTPCYLNQAPAPDIRRIPAADLLGVTLVMLVCRYLSQNFVRVHYFVRVEYSDPALNDVPPPVADVEKVLTLCCYFSLSLRVL